MNSSPSRGRPSSLRQTPASGASHLVAFGDFELDLERDVLTSGGELVALRPAAVRALVLLVRRAGELTSREELRRHLWRDSHVEWKTGLHQCIRQVRRALGDDAESPRFVETVPRRGYRFIAPVRACLSRGVEPAGAPPAAEQRRAAPWRARWLSFAAGVTVTLAVPSVLVVICALLAR